MRSTFSTCSTPPALDVPQNQTQIPKATAALPLRKLSRTTTARWDISITAKLSPATCPLTRHPPRPTSTGCPSSMERENKSPFQPRSLTDRAPAQRTATLPQPAAPTTARTLAPSPGSSAVRVLSPWASTSRSRTELLQQHKSGAFRGSRFLCPPMHRRATQQKAPSRSWRPLIVSLTPSRDSLPIRLRFAKVEPCREV